VPVRRASSCTSRPLKWPVTPEVAGSSPVAPVSPFALQTTFSVVCIGERGPERGQQTGSNFPIDESRKSLQNVALHGVQPYGMRE
jgi:hypothetical protein